MIEDWKSYRYSKHAIRIYCSLLLGMIGIIASVATIYALPLEGASTLSCGIEKLSCSTALQSKFSKLFGIPLGIFGVLFCVLDTQSPCVSTDQQSGLPVFAFLDHTFRCSRIIGLGHHYVFRSWSSLFLLPDHPSKQYWFIYFALACQEMEDGDSIYA